MRKIAMRCTQEQFESIKDRIKYKDIASFKEYPYLTNHNTSYEKGTVTNTTVLIQSEVYETFDAEIFLKACDSWEDEKIWSGKDMQYLYKGEWIDCQTNSDFRFKPKFNSANYSKGIEALQFKAKENGMKCTINFEKI